MHTLIGEQVRLRPATVADGARFGEILSQPEVARWWGNPAEHVEDLLDASEGTSSFAIEFAGTTVGLIQCSEELSTDFRHAGIDIAVHPDWHGRGIGTDAIVTLATHLTRDRGHHRLTIDPAAANEAAIRVYARIGFRPVGIAPVLAGA